MKAPGHPPVPDPGDEQRQHGHEVELTEEGLDDRERVSEIAGGGVVPVAEGGERDEAEVDT